ncbi:MAG: hypothetical protein ACYDA8_23670 [Deferrisomatales bacterium]
MRSGDDRRDDGAPGAAADPAECAAFVTRENLKRLLAPRPPARAGTPDP